VSSGSSCPWHHQIQTPLVVPGTPAPPKSWSNPRQASLSRQEKNPESVVVGSILILFGLQAAPWRIYPRLPASPSRSWALHGSFIILIQRRCLVGFPPSQERICWGASLSLSLSHRLPNASRERKRGPTPSLTIVAKMARTINYDFNHVCSRGCLRTRMNLNGEHSPRKSI
jgi:hypothetical protein